MSYSDFVILPTWQPVGESNPSYLVENQVSYPIDERATVGEGLSNQGLRAAQEEIYALCKGCIFQSKLRF